MRLCGYAATASGAESTAAAVPFGRQLCGSSRARSRCFSVCRRFGVPADVLLP